MFPAVYSRSIPKSELLTVLINRFSLTITQTEACSIYYKLHWTGEYFRDQLSNGTITRDGVTYNVVYKDCKPTDIKRKSTLWLSFRKARKDYELPGFVIVVVRD